jgi:hypothetical protein
MHNIEFSFNEAQLILIDMAKSYQNLKRSDDFFSKVLGHDSHPIKQKITVVESIANKLLQRETINQ